MSTKSKIKQRERYRCQMCGDYQGKIYDSGVIVVVQAHHIIPKSEGGTNMPGNLITLCDFCHDVVTSEKWNSQFGDMGTPENMEWIKQNFEKYLKLDYNKREKIKKDLWEQFGIK